MASPRLTRISAHSDSQPGRYTQNAALARVLLAPFKSLLFKLTEHKTPHKVRFYVLAERVGFEPTGPLTGSQVSNLLL